MSDEPLTPEQMAALRTTNYPEWHRRVLANPPGQKSPVETGDEEADFKALLKVNRVLAVRTYPDGARKYGLK